MIAKFTSALGDVKVGSFEKGKVGIHFVVRVADDGTADSFIFGLVVVHSFFPSPNLPTISCRYFSPARPVPTCPLLPSPCLLLFHLICPPFQTQPARPLVSPHLPAVSLTWILTQPARHVSLPTFFFTYSPYLLWTHLFLRNHAFSPTRHICIFTYLPYLTYVLHFNLPAF